MEHDLSHKLLPLVLKVHKKHRGNRHQMQSSSLMATIYQSGQAGTETPNGSSKMVIWKLLVPATLRPRKNFGDCQLHLEWAAPVEVKGDSQGRGNSGVFLMGKYEIQVLDGYDNPTYADGITSAIYGQYPPLVNACGKPGEWQTFDIFFTAPRFGGEKLISPAYITVIHNGVLVHHHRAAMGPTGHRRAPSYDEPHPAQGPLVLQDHGDPVRYRNIWGRPL